MTTLNTIESIMLISQLSYLEVRRLISHVTGLTLVKIMTNPQLVLTELDYMRVTDLIKRRLNGEPLAYLLGYKEFYSREFRVTKDTLIPRPETELVVDQVLAITGIGDSILDLGTGSGCIAISCKLERSDLRVTAVDKYSATLAVAKANARHLGAGVDFIVSDWFSQVMGRFNVIVSNPPYIAKGDEHLLQLGYEPLYALTDNASGYECILHIVKHSVDYLEAGGSLIIEHGYNQGLAVQQIFIDNGFTAVITSVDYANLPRITSGIYKK